MAGRILTAFLNQEDKSSNRPSDLFKDADLSKIFNNKPKKHNKKGRHERNVNYKSESDYEDEPEDEQSSDNGEVAEQQNFLMRFINFCKENPETVIDYTYKAIGLISAGYTAYSYINGSGPKGGARSRRISRRANRDATDFFRSTRR